MQSSAVLMFQKLSAREQFSFMRLMTRHAVSIANSVFCLSPQIPVLSFFRWIPLRGVSFRLLNGGRLSAGQLPFHAAPGADLLDCASPPKVVQRYENAPGEVGSLVAVGLRI